MEKILLEGVISLKFLFKSCFIRKLQNDLTVEKYAFDILVGNLHLTEDGESFEDPENIVDWLENLTMSSIIDL